MKLRKLLLAFAILLNISPLVLVPSAVHAQNAAADAICEGVGASAAAGGSGCEATGGSTVQAILKVALNLISIVIGIVAVIMIMIGGFKYVTSGGEGAKTASAKDTILYAVIGLVVVAFAQIIVKFVLTKVTK